MAVPAPQHRVQRLLIELAGTPQALPAAGAAALQAAAQRRLQQQLLPVLDRLCSSLGDAGQVQRIDRLEIDLGAWPAEAWSGDGLPAQALRARFEATLSRQLGQALQTAAAVQTDAELAASCLHTGQLPWWADAADRGALQRALAALLARPLAAGAAWLPPADPHAPAMQRLVAALDDAQLAALVARLGGRAAAAQAGAPTAALPWPALLAQVAQALGLGPAALRRAWWAEALAAALQAGTGTGAGAGGSPWLPALQRLPTRLGRTEAALAAAWRRALDNTHTTADADPAGLAPLWQALDGAWPARRASPAAGPGGAPADAPGRVPVPAPVPAGPGAADALLAGLAAAPGGAPGPPWQPWLLAWLAVPQAAAQRQRLVAALWATPGADRAPLAEAVASLQAALHTVPWPAPGAPTAATLAGWLAAAVAARQRGAGRQPPAVARAATGLATRAAPDTLYIANAGLVLLWPFLQRLAGRLGLLHDRQFASPAHAARAAVLLQCLATGDAEPPEFQLPLNKLLCGLPLDAPILLDDPLSADEQAECEALLVAVVAAAPVLRQMSPAGLRSAFLQRPGQLGMQDGHWLLRVERAAHDVVLDRFPWSAALLRLPWMPRLLQVQW